MAVVTPTDRPLKSVRNRCVIELFYGVVCVVTFDISAGVGALIIGLSQICSFFSYKYIPISSNVCTKFNSFATTYRILKYEKRLQRSGKTGICDCKMIQFIPANHSNSYRVITILIYSYKTHF